MKRSEAQSEFLEALTKASRKIRTAFNQRVTAHGLTYPRARALWRLAEKPDMAQAELAFELELEQATMVRLLDRMEEHGLIERRPSPNDRRVKLIALTPHGEEQATMVRSIANQMRQEVFADIDMDDLRGLTQLLHAVSGRVADLESLHVPA
ncbi:MarR family transcriptional regulator for hemolysin [Neorhizobium huautlense]|uniref:MarR family transcriptional regulator for hemolysin n=1 Tax=Neorhizobium huautlense TaxID=67774 RepID=A0ABT9PLV2_9HYPH|nr:MarR family transcriptional regulator [Neorhizobium huautlense]MDP9835432.1 MarR family transcriptional regulator for hemolysin [Neorhizobium huautlense]